MLNKKTVISLILFVLCLQIVFIESSTACTIGVASAKATADGRPLIWKTTDREYQPHNKLYYSTEHEYKFIAVSPVYDNNDVGIGLNQSGLAIAGVPIGDLMSNPDKISIGMLQKLALGTCATVDEFEQLLKKTSATGRLGRSSIAVMDAAGQAAIFEIAPGTYKKFGTKDPKVAPNGWLIRTNLAPGKAGFEADHNIKHYRRVAELTKQIFNDGKIGYREIIRKLFRDFTDSDNNPADIPYPHKPDSDSPFGYLECSDSICSYSTVSAAVIHGLLPGENPQISTLWAILGNPSVALATPYWPIGQTPAVSADGSKKTKLCSAAIKAKPLVFNYYASRKYIDTYKLQDDDGHGVWAITFRTEDKIFEQTEMLMEKWRKDPNATEMLEAENEFGNNALSTVKKVYSELRYYVPERTKPSTFEPMPDVDKTVETEMSLQSAVGVVIGLIRDHKIIYLKGYGYADRENKILVTNDTLFRWASISKTLTAIAALQLWEQGRLKLDEDIRTYVPEFPDTNEVITTRQLLCHQAGIPHYGKIVKTQKNYATEHPFESVITALDTFNASSLIGTPGKKYFYSTHGFILASAVIERAGNQKFADQIHDRICKPLGLKSLQPDYQWKDIPNRAVGYTKKKDNKWHSILGLEDDRYGKITGQITPSTDTDISWKLGGGGFISNIDDMARFALAVMNSELISKRAERLMFTPQRTANGKLTPHGLGFRVSGTGRNLTISHSGDQEKTRTLMVIYPEKGTGVVIMVNGQYTNPRSFVQRLFPLISSR